MAWLSGYSKRKELTLTGGASGAQTYFQLKIAVSYEAAMQGDFDDLRFTQIDGTTLIDAWAELIVTDTSATVWVEFPTTPANTVEQTYYMYYGNAGAVSDWDIGATFLFGDDFPGSSLNLTKWDVNAGTPAVSDGLTLSGEVEAIWSDNSFGPLNIAFRSRVKMGETNRKHELGLTDNTSSAATGKVASADSNNFGIQLYSDGNLYSCANNGSGGQTQVNEYAYNTNYHIYDFTLVSGSAKFYDDGIEQREETSNIPTGTMPIWFDMRESVGSIDVDWTFIRKYVANPPTYAFGSEESVPSGNPYWYYNMLKRRN